MICKREKRLPVSAPYLWIPVDLSAHMEKIRRHVCLNGFQAIITPSLYRDELKTLTVLQEDGTTVMEFLVPDMESNSCSYTAALEVSEQMGQTIVLKGNFSDRFFEQVCVQPKLPPYTGKRPFVHFASWGGWQNDPCGLVFLQGDWHLFYQHNPFGKQWENICWGHAVSRDLLHWEQAPEAVLPDENGLIFTGSAMVNQHGALGLPEDATLFVYCSAGNYNEWSRTKRFEQRVFFSTDHCRTFRKMPEPLLPFMVDENRDPKIFYHEPSGGYCMVMFLEKHEYAILRSEDFKQWSIVQKLTFHEGWECPDLVKLKADDGTEHWAFLTAGGEYLVGEFDGYRFSPLGGIRNLYLTRWAYAGQSFANVPDRTVWMFWVRSLNLKEMYTGMMGLPRELSLLRSGNDYRLSMLPVREWQQIKKCIDESTGVVNRALLIRRQAAVEIEIDCAEAENITLAVFGIRLTCEPAAMQLTCQGEPVKTDQRLSRIHFLVDRHLVEMWSDDGCVSAGWETDMPSCKGWITLMADAPVCIKVWQ